MSHTTKQNNHRTDSTASKMISHGLSFSKANTCPKLRAISSENLDIITSKR